MITQAFLYNAVFFTQGLTLTTFFKVPAGDVGLYIIPFAIGNFLGRAGPGPLLRHGRAQEDDRRLLHRERAAALADDVPVPARRLTATTLTVCWSVMFFFASAGASAAYLTVSEIFPLETRAAAIAVVYAVGTLVGGAIAPPIYGHLIGTGQPSAIALGWVIGAVLMMVGGGFEIVLGVDAENKSLEDIASPLTQVQQPQAA